MSHSWRAVTLKEGWQWYQWIADTQTPRTNCLIVVIWYVWRIIHIGSYNSYDTIATVVVGTIWHQDTHNHNNDIGQSVHNAQIWHHQWSNTTPTTLLCDHGARWTDWLYYKTNIGITDNNAFIYQWPCFPTQVHTSTKLVIIDMKTAKLRQKIKVYKTDWHNMLNTEL